MDVKFEPFGLDEMLVSRPCILDQCPRRGWLKPLAFRRSKIIDVPKATRYLPTEVGGLRN
jgi:hypothetical protein